MWLSPTSFVDRNTPGFIELARTAVGNEIDPMRRAVALYSATRDSVTYTLYCDYR